MFKIQLEGRRCTFYEFELWDYNKALFRTPLHIAIERNSVELAYIMIQSGANPDIKDIIGRYFFSRMKKTLLDITTYKPL